MSERPGGREEGPTTSPNGRRRMILIVAFLGAIAVAVVILAITVIAPLLTSPATFSVRTQTTSFSVCWSVSFTVDGSDVVIDEEGRKLYVQRADGWRTTVLGGCNSGLTVRIRPTSDPHPEEPVQTLTVEILRDGQVVETDSVEALGSTQFVRYTC